MTSDFFLRYCDYGMIAGVRNIWTIYIYSTLKIIVLLVVVTESKFDCDIKYEYSEDKLFCLMT